VEKEAGATHLENEPISERTRDRTAKYDIHIQLVPRKSVSDSKSSTWSSNMIIIPLPVDHKYLNLCCQSCNISEHLVHLLKMKRH
jgi:hypothetical protein